MSMDDLNDPPAIRLFLFPYAGGSAAAYRTWREALPSWVLVQAVELPGHGSRLLEQPIDRLSPLISTLADELTPSLQKPFAFFGHSLGALLAFELSRRLRQDCGIEPECLFVSGRPAPRWPVPLVQLHQLPDDELRLELERLNGTPAEVLDNDEMMAIILRILRADLAISEKLRVRNRPASRGSHDRSWWSARSGSPRTVSRAVA